MTNRKAHVKSGPRPPLQVAATRRAFRLLPRGVLICVLLAAIQCVQAAVIHYGYDADHRLTSAAYTNGASHSYTYDNAGNLLQRAAIVPGAAPVPGGDSDSDGMDDAWEQLYFGNLSRNGTGDFDGDGATDLAEFLAGTVPNSAASVFKIIRVTPTPGVSALIEWNSVPGKTYHVEYKNSLSAPAWSDLPGDVTANSSTASKVDATIGGAGHRHYRVALGAGAAASPPVLAISRVNSLIHVSWPSSTPAGFSLETTTNLTSVIVWSPVTNVPSDNGTNKAVNLNLNPAVPAHFYRLRQ